MEIHHITQADGNTTSQGVNFGVITDILSKPDTHTDIIDLS